MARSRARIASDAARLAPTHIARKDHLAGIKCKHFAIFPEARKVPSRRPRGRRKRRAQPLAVFDGQHIGVGGVDGERTNRPVMGLDGVDRAGQGARMSNRSSRCSTSGAPRRQTACQDRPAGKDCRAHHRSSHRRQLLRGVGFRDQDAMQPERAIAFVGAQLFELRQHGLDEFCPSTRRRSPRRHPVELSGETVLLFASSTERGWCSTAAGSRAGRLAITIVTTIEATPVPQHGGRRGSTLAFRGEAVIERVVKLGSCAPSRPPPSSSRKSRGEELGAVRSGDSAVDDGEA